MGFLEVFLFARRAFCVCDQCWNFPQLVKRRGWVIIGGPWVAAQQRPRSGSTRFDTGTVYTMPMLMSGTSDNDARVGQHDEAWNIEEQQRHAMQLVPQGPSLQGYAAWSVLPSAPMHEISRSSPDNGLSRRVRA